MFDRKEAAKQVGAGVLQGVGGTIYGAILLLLGSLVAWFVSRGHGQLTMTRADWVIFTLGSSVALAILFCCGVWAWPRVASLIRDWKNGTPPTSLEEPSSQGIDDQPEIGEPVEFVLRGEWLNTPFRCSVLNANNLGEPLFAEDLSLQVIAKDTLENVSLSIAVKNANGADDDREYLHQGKFAGTVTPGMTDTIRVFRRVFRVANGELRLADGTENASAQFRRDVSASFFDGTTFEMPISGSDLRALVVTVHHRLGTVRARFTVDLRVMPAPRSRVVLGNGPIKFQIPNNFANPAGFPMGDENLI